MTKQEIIEFLSGMIAEDTSIIKLDAAKWAEFKTAVIAVLNDPAGDPKYKTAVEQIGTIINSTLT